MACLRYDAQARGIVPVRTPVAPTTRLPMPDLASLFPVIVAPHVCLALAHLVPSLPLPCTLQAREGGVDRGWCVGRAAEPGRATRLLLLVQAHGTVTIGAGLGLTGLARADRPGQGARSRPARLRATVALAALATCAVTLGMAFFLQRPELRRLLGRGGEMTPEDRRRWLAPGPPPAPARLSDHDRRGVHYLPGEHQAAAPVIG